MARVRTTTLLKRKEAGEKIVCLTAYDYPMARILDEAGVHLVLAGDSAGTAVAGNEDTLSVTMDQMVYHTQMVSRAVKSALVIADMPFLSYHVSVTDAVRNAGRFVAEAGAHGVKLEGPADKFGEVIAAILRVGIPVMGHIGLVPQSLHQIGGYKVQGRDPNAGERLKEEATGLQNAGCFAVVLECVQAQVAAEITEMLTIPTIGIGSGPSCDGQILVTPDMLGFGEDKKFVKVYKDVRAATREAVDEYVKEVIAGTFPAEEHSFL